MNMLRTLIVVFLAALVTTGVAYGAYPGVYGLQDGPALTAGSLQIRVSKAAGDTEIITPSRRATVSGSYGIPTPDGIDTSTTVKGLFYSGGLDQLKAQFIGSLTCVVVISVVSLLLFFAVDLTRTLRVSAGTGSGAPLDTFTPLLGKALKLEP